MPKKRSKTRPSKAPLDTDIQSQSTDNIRADDGVHELGPSSSKIPRSSLSEMQEIAKSTTSRDDSRSRSSRVLLGRGIQSRTMVNVNLADYDPEPRITGIAVMPDGHIVLSDFRNHAVKLLDNSWSLTDSLWVEQYPSDVAVVDASTVIVSSRTHLQFVHVLPHLKAGRKMKQFKRSEGVVVYGDEIYVLCHLLTPSSQGEIRVLGMNLKLKRRLGFNEEDKTYLFKDPLKIAINSSGERIFVSENQSVTCITSLDGHVVFKYDGLNCAGGLYCDSADNILLCGSKCIEVITAGGKKSTLLSEREFSEDLWGDTASDIPRQQPCSIAYRHSEETLIIGCFHFDSIFLFKLTK